MSWRLIMVMTAAIVAILFGIAAFLAQDNIAQFTLNPRVPYEAYEPPGAPDYGDPADWLLLPDPSAEIDGPAIFYVPGTVYRRSDHWNAPLDAPAYRDPTKRIAIPNEAGPFMELGPIYAPAYRQATLFAFFTQKHQGRAARTLAYADVRAAFDNFLDRIGPERPFILVGYNQGGLQVTGLLVDRLNADPGLHTRLVAAYAIDQPVPLDMFDGALAAVEPCLEPEDVRCVASWVAYSDHFEREMRRSREQLLVWDRDEQGAFDLLSVKGRKLLCTNPVSWSYKHPNTDQDRHAGAASATGLSLADRPALVERAVATSCDNGILTHSLPAKAWLRRPRLFGNKWRPLEFNLFYGDIQANAALRWEAYQKVVAAEEAYVPPIEREVVIGDSPINEVPN